jgi:hypothetical protein
MSGFDPERGEESLDTIGAAPSPAPNLLAEGDPA